MWVESAPGRQVQNPCRIRPPGGPRQVNKRRSRPRPRGACDKHNPNRPEVVVEKSDRILGGARRHQREAESGPVSMFGVTMYG